MWISKKKWANMENRIADLEYEVQSQQLAFHMHLEAHKQENNDFHKALTNIKEELYKGMQQIL